MRIAICTPCHGDVTREYAISLAHMLLFTSRCGFVFNGQPTSPHIQVMMESTALLPQARTTLTTRAVTWNADYLLWIDADHSFPEDALVRLLTHSKDIVGVNYPRRCRPTSPTATGLDGTHVWTTRELAIAGELEEVNSVGFGFCLVSMPVIGALAGAGKPLYAVGFTKDLLRYVGEDVYFCEVARAAGYQIFVDHGLSWQIGHVSRTELFNQDAVADKAAFLSDGSA